MTTKISTSAKPTSLKRVNSILVSQPPPPANTKNAFNDLETKYGLKVDYRAFNHVEGVSEKDFRKERIRRMSTIVSFLTVNMVSRTSSVLQKK